MTAPRSMSLALPGEQVLADARERIVTLHADILAHLETALRKAIRLGKELVTVQPHLKHSRQYQDWVSANLPFSVRTAQDYVTLFRNREIIENDGDANNLTIRSALKLIRDTAKAASPVEVEPGPLEVDLEAEGIDESDPVKLANREVLLVEADAGFIAELLSLVRHAEKAGHDIVHQRISASCLDPLNKKFLEILNTLNPHKRP